MRDMNRIVFQTQKGKKEYYCIDQLSDNIFEQIKADFSSSVITEDEIRLSYEKLESFFDLTDTSTVNEVIGKIHTYFKQKVSRSA